MTPAALPQNNSAYDRHHLAPATPTGSGVMRTPAYVPRNKSADRHDAHQATSSLSSCATSSATDVSSNAGDHTPAPIVTGTMSGQSTKAADESSPATRNEQVPPSQANSLLEEINDLKHEIRRQQQQKENDAMDAFKFEQILRECVAQQAETIERLNVQIAEMKKEHECAIRVLERRNAELVDRSKSLEALRETAAQFIRTCAVAPTFSARVSNTELAQVLQESRTRHDPSPYYQDPNAGFTAASNQPQ